MSEGAHDARVSYTSQAGDLVLVRRSFETACCGRSDHCTCVEYDDDGFPIDEDIETEWEFVPVEVIRVTGSDDDRARALAIFHGPAPTPAPDGYRPSLTERIHAAGIPTRERVAA